MKTVISILVTFLLTVQLGFAQNGVELKPSGTVNLTGNTPGVFFKSDAFTIEGIIQNDEDRVIFQGVNKDINFTTSSSLLLGSNLIIKNNGFVGIGESLPTARLHVTSSSELAVFESSNTDNFIGIGNTVNGTFTKKGYFGIFSGNDDIDIGTGYGNITGNVNLVIASSPRATLLSNGNFGIGTTTPDQELDVNGDIALTDGTGRIEFKEGSLVKAFLNYNGTDLTLENAETGDADIFIDATDDLFFQSGASGFTRMFIDQDGKVGIGTTSIPSGYLVAIDGNAIAEELFVELSTSWPDYVFEQDYSLLPLDELATFIEAHGHLPNIPSAAEMESRKTQSIGETQLLLLEKIEELTLYVLELNEKNEALEAKVQELKKALNQ